MQRRQRYVEEESRSAGVRILIPEARIFINESAPSRVCPGPLGWSQIRRCRCSSTTTATTHTLEEEDEEEEAVEKTVLSGQLLGCKCTAEEESRERGHVHLPVITPDRTPAVRLYNQSLPPPPHPLLYYHVMQN